MKKIKEQVNKAPLVTVFLFTFLLFGAVTINAQIGIGTPTPNASAKLDVSSTTKGFLPPRMTHSERNAIPNPAAGLMIWCKDCGVSGEIQVFNGSVWTKMVGETPISSVVIGSQVWTKSNLDVTTYRNGDPIPQATSIAELAAATSGLWCYYDFDPDTGIYGKLYNWYAVMDPRGLAPLGWHVPDNAEWTTLTNYLGGRLAAGGKMKTKHLWGDPNVRATNESGFTALPGGWFNSIQFGGIGGYGVWWSTTIYNNFPWSRYLYSRGGTIESDQRGKSDAYSVRCIRD